MESCHTFAIPGIYPRPQSSIGHAHGHIDFRYSVPLLTLESDTVLTPDIDSAFGSGHCTYLHPLNIVMTSVMRGSGLH